MYINDNSIAFNIAKTFCLFSLLFLGLTLVWQLYEIKTNNYPTFIEWLDFVH